MARYVDGYVLPLPKRKLALYRKLAGKSGRIWLEHGALQYLESVADDVKPGKLTSFPQSVELKRGETVIFAFVIYRSRKQRDRVNAKVTADPRMKAMFPDATAFPFDGKRMIWGGFEAIVDLAD